MHLGCVHQIVDVALLIISLRTMPRAGHPPASLCFGGETPRVAPFAVLVTFAPDAP